MRRQTTQTFLMTMTHTNAARKTKNKRSEAEMSRQTNPSRKQGKREVKVHRIKRDAVSCLRDVDGLRA
jgi:hypothetical protein